MINIIPIDDLEEHKNNSTCKCNPKVIFENGEIILVHYAFDKRHITEEITKDLEFLNLN